jgi:hypothetical protein
VLNIYEVLNCFQDSETIHNFSDLGVIQRFLSKSLSDMEYRRFYGDLTLEELEFREELERFFEQFPTVEIDTNDIIFPGGLRWNEVSDDLEPFR